MRKELYLTVHPDDLVELYSYLSIHPKALIRSSVLLQHGCRYVQGLCRIVNEYIRNIVIDSPGFEYVRGRLPQVTLDDVCAMYRRLYSTIDIPDKMFVHFDIPTPYYAPRELRLRLLELNYANYVEMVSRLGNGFPLLYVVHGWTENEIKTCIELYETEKSIKVATPSYLAESHARAVRSGPTGFTSLRSVVATPTYLPTAHTRAVRIGKTGLASIGKIALGSYMAMKNPRVDARNGILDTSTLAQYYVKTVPKREVWLRLITAMNILRNKYEVFVLGGASPNTAHLIFLCGARAIDGSSWTFSAKLGRIFIPEYGEVKPRQVLNNEKLLRILQEYWNRPDNPLRDLVKIEQFLEFTSEPWREKGVRGIPEGFTAWLLRATWNLYVMKIEEEIANEYATDFERYVRYLEKRFSKNPQHRNTLKLILRNIRKPYVQTRLDIYLRTDTNHITRQKENDNKNSNLR